MGGDCWQGLRRDECLLTRAVRNLKSARFGRAAAIDLRDNKNRCQAGLRPGNGVAMQRRSALRDAANAHCGASCCNLGHRAFVADMCDGAVMSERHFLSVESP